MYYANVCESFSCLPLAGGAIDQPVGLMRRIMLYRSYKFACEMRERKVPVPDDGPPEWADYMALQVWLQRQAEDEAR